MPDSAPSIHVEDLSFRYAGRRRAALANLSFDVQAGETLLVLGPSGCGKSTLALCLNGLIPHSVGGERSGQVLIGGRDVHDVPVAELAQTVGLVFQDPDVQFCMLRVDDEIAFGLENLRVPAKEMPDRIRRALAIVGLAGAERLRIDRLSGGARQRLALACVLVMEPPLLVFDEPTSNLDPAGTQEVFATIGALKARGNRTIVIVEHRLDNIMHLVDRVLALGPDGRTLAFGQPRHVLQEHGAELEQFGVWVPQVSALANRLAARRLALTPYPLTVADAVEAIGQVLVAKHSPASIDRISGSNGALDDHDRHVSIPSPVNQHSGEPGNLETPVPAIEISHLSWSYPSGPPALRNISLTVPAGSFSAIAGPNGAGKSTLASLLVGAIQPAKGTVRLFGRDARALRSSELTQVIGYVFQNPEHQFVAPTVRDEVAYGLKLRGRPADEISTRAETMLADFSLSSLAKANPFTLSYGEKRRLSVAAMLVLEPRILVLDEPTFGQDRQNTEMLMTKLVELNRGGRTILIITHDTRLVAEYCGQVAVLVGGEVAYAGRGDSLFDDRAILRRGGLDLPPILDLSRRLSRFDPTFPEVVTLDQMVAVFEGRSRSAADVWSVSTSDDHVSSLVRATSRPGEERT